MENSRYNIRYLPNQKIDKGKWDDCISSASLPVIYAMSTYLDSMCKRWDALVFDDYKVVMPLPWNRKWLVAYVYSPYFVVAGGVFGKEVTEELFSAFISAIPRHFRYVDIDLNEHNFFPSSTSHDRINYHQRRNTFLSLNRSYEDFVLGYHSQAKRKLKKATTHQFSVDKSQSVRRIIELYKDHYKEKDSVITRFDFAQMIALLEGNLEMHTKTYLLSFPDGEMAAFYLLLYDEHFVYWLIGGSSTRGKEASAFYYLTDLVIRDFANTNRNFRFEGSDQKGIHFFNSQFGGQTVYYPHIRINRLPWPLRYLK